MKQERLQRLCALCLAVFCAFFCFAVPRASAASPDYSEYPLIKNNLLAGKIIILDPGHSDTSGPAYGSFVEGLHNRLVAEALRRDLENCGATVYLTREGSSDVRPNCVRMAYVNKIALDYLLRVRTSERAAMDDSSEEAGKADEKIAEIRRLIKVMQSVLKNHDLQNTYFNTPYDYNRKRKIHPDLEAVFELENDPVIWNNFIMISLHSNAPGGNPMDTSVNGATSYRLTNTYWEIANYYTNYCNVDRNLRLSRTLLRHVCAAAGFKNNGVVTNDLFMLRETNIPVTLLENGFHTNAKDRAVLTSAEGRQKIATGITMGILEYYGKTYDRGEILAETYGYSAGTGSVDGDYVSAAAAGLTEKQFLGKLKAKEGVTLSVADEKGNEKAAGDTMRTGDRLIVTDAEGASKTYTVAVRGDLNRDGKIALADLLMVQKYMLGTLKLDGDQLEAGDIDRDGKDALSDLLLIQKHLLGTKLIR